MIGKKKEMSSQMRYKMEKKIWNIFDLVYVVIAMITMNLPNKIALVILCLLVLIFGTELKVVNSLGSKLRGSQ